MTLTERLAAYFRAWPDTDIDARGHIELAAVWLTRYCVRRAMALGLVSLREAS